MAKVGVDDLYLGTEKWDVQSSVAQFISDFEDTTVRGTVMSDAVYISKPKISAFMSEQTLKDLTGFTSGTLRESTLRGVVLLLGYDGTNLVVIARSANGRAARPSGSQFTNLNYKNTNNSLTDAQVTTLTNDFASTAGYAKLSGWAANDHPTFSFDRNLLLNLLYSNAPGSADATPATLHIVIAPPWSDDTANKYISIVAQSGTKYRGEPPCPPYCYQNA